MTLDWTRARELAGQGMYCAQIAAEIGRSHCTVRQWAIREGVQLAIGKRGAKPQRTAPTDRSARMASMYRQGLTLKKIGDHFGLTRERVRQLIKALGLTGVDGGQAQQARSKVERKTNALAARVRSKWGVDVDAWRVLRKDGTIRRYEYHRRNSAMRAIPFLLTFPEWLAIWQASGKLHLCGRGKGHYCMSRINDAGGYEVGNVHVQLTTENSAEAVKKWRGKVKANRGVFLLYPGRPDAWFAKCGTVRLGFHATEQEAVAAREAYLKANPLKRGGGIGRGRGWTFVKSAKTRPYQVQACGTRSYHATQAEAEAAYRAICEAHLAQRSADAQTLAEAA